MLGPVYGTLTTILGGLFLMGNFNEPLALALFNIACSATGPLIALYSFRLSFKRRVELTSLRDLATLTLLYCISNSLVHHTAWQILESTRDFDLQEAAWMFIGDFNGALLGAYLTKALIDALEKRGFNFSGSSQTKN